jgi:hypothetical protein
MTARRSQIRHIDVEILSAFRATVDGVGQMDIAWTARDQISQIVQNPLPLAMPIGAVSTLRTRPLGEVAAASNDLRFGQIFGIGDALGGIGQVFSRPWHGGTLRGMAPLLPIAPRICEKYAVESRSKPNSFATVSKNSPMRKRPKQPCTRRSKKRFKPRRPRSDDWPKKSNA